MTEKEQLAYNIYAISEQIFSKEPFTIAFGYDVLTSDVNKNIVNIDDKSQYTIASYDDMKSVFAHIHTCCTEIICMQETNNFQKLSDILQKCIDKADERCTLVTNRLASLVLDIGLDTILSSQESVSEDRKAILGFRVLFVDNGMTEVSFFVGEKNDFVSTKRLYSIPYDIFIQEDVRPYIL